MIYDLKLELKVAVVVSNYDDNNIAICWKPLKT